MSDLSATAADDDEPTPLRAEPSARRGKSLDDVLGPKAETHSIAVVAVGPHSGKEGFVLALRSRVPAGWVVTAPAEVNPDHPAAGIPAAEIVVLVVPPAVEAMVRGASWARLAANPAVAGHNALGPGTLRVLLNVGGPGDAADADTAAALFPGVPIYTADLNDELDQHLTGAIIAGSKHAGVPSRSSRWWANR
ncbi:MAG TPA: hypothetical protein VHD87_12680 [Acidimicrobiales bacterium]|nr:hypothetical protein [Acidimicrobiales bacterium]